MRISLINTVSEFKKYNSDGVIGIYLVSITGTDSNNGNKVIVMNGKDIGCIFNYSDGSKIEYNLTSDFKNEFILAYNRYKDENGIK